jgi:hypothetical protein
MRSCGHFVETASKPLPRVFLRAIRLELMGEKLVLKPTKASLYVGPVSGELLNVGVGEVSRHGTPHLARWL